MSITRLPAERTGLSSDATIAGGMVYTTVIPVDAANEIVGTDIRAQTAHCFLLLEEVLRSAESGLDSLVHLTIYLSDIERDREGFNVVYGDVFADLPVPVRCAVGVAALARPGFLVELTAIAARA